MIWPILFIAAAVGLDQLTKYWASTDLVARGSVPLWNGVFHLTYVENRGAAFGMLQDSRWFLIIVTVFAVILIFWALRKRWFENALGRWAAYFVLAGAFGNLIDRSLNGFVVDMFDFRLINFAVFNVADSFVSVGGAMFVQYILLYYLRERKQEKKADGEN